jgi:DNA-directed RNA polymerase subunit RPC12/RpoP
MEDAITITVNGHTRTVRLRAVSYTCQECGGTFTIQQHLGRPPRHCPACRAMLERWRREDDRDAAAARMRRLREARRASQSASPLSAPPDHTPAS